MTDQRTTVVVITHNRRDDLMHTLDRLAELPERPPVIVVDNASQDGSAEAVRRRHPHVRLLEPGRNLGAVGRNLAARLVSTPYIAFCDDDSWWDPGSLAGAADLLDAHPRLAAVTARILVHPHPEGTGRLPRRNRPRTRSSANCGTPPWPVLRGYPAPLSAPSSPLRPCCAPTPSAPPADSLRDWCWEARRNCSRPTWRRRAGGSATPTA